MHILLPGAELGTFRNHAVEYASAGHLPILHHRHRGGDTTRISVPQLPLGLIPGGQYASQRVSYSPGDVFLLLTDGITEVVNHADEEFGLARLEQLLSKNAAQPLSQIWEVAMAEVRQHGSAEGGQDLLGTHLRCSTTRTNPPKSSSSPHRPASLASL